MIYGYLRVSTGGQTADNQQLAIFKAGYKPDEWIEVHASATVPSQKRQIDRLLKLLKPGDTLVKGVEKCPVEACFQFPLNAKSAFFSILIDAVAY